MMRTLAKVVLREADLILTTDIHTKNLLLPLSRKTPYLCIPTPIQTGLFENNGKRRFEKVVGDTLVFGFVGRLCKQKNLQLLLKAFASVPVQLRMTLSLIIVGDGPERIFLEHEAIRLGIKGNVILTGNVSENRKLELLKSFDVFVLPSIYEGCPISLLEAMASSKAIIASNIPSIKQIVRHNQEAILIDPYNVEELRDAIM
jgi:glycosyltransferase involved in cell wall biosynthesis